MQHHLIKPENLAELLLAGNALLTFKSKHTGDHYTFKIIRDPQSTEGNQMYQVRHLNKIIGRLIDMQFHIYPPAYEFTPAQKAMGWIWKHILLPDAIERNMAIYHHGLCVRCGRTLTDPESITRGIGPECIKLINK